MWARHDVFGTGSSQELRRMYAARLAAVQSRLSADGIKFRVLGSIAASAYVDGPGAASLNFNREWAFMRHQRFPDVDILVPKVSLAHAQRISRELASDSAMPINVELLSGICHFDYRPESGVSYITHRKLRVPIPSDLFDAVEVNFLGTRLTTIDPLTLFHTYVTMGAVLRDKDWPVALRLARLIQNEAASGRVEAEYVGFHEFIRERARRYHGYVISRYCANWIMANVPYAIYSLGVHVGKIFQPRVFGSR